MWPARKWNRHVALGDIFNLIFFSPPNQNKYEWQLSGKKRNNLAEFSVTRHGDGNGLNGVWCVPPRCGGTRRAEKLAASSAVRGRKLTWVLRGWCANQSYDDGEKRHPRVHDCGTGLLERKKVDVRSNVECVSRRSPRLPCSPSCVSARCCWFCSAAPHFLFDRSCGTSVREGEEEVESHVYVCGVRQLPRAREVPLSVILPS